MTVIAVIGVLVGTIIPVVQSSLDQATATTEMNSARRLIEGYESYGTDHQGRLIAGYLSEDDPLDPDFEDLHTAIGPDGTVLEGREKRRWTWRLMPYLDNRIESMFVNQGLDYIRTHRGTDDFAYIASAHPSFGLNAEWLGGMKGATYSDLHDLGNYVGKCYYAQRRSEIRRPSQQLVFTSSRATELTGTQVVEGHFYVLSPWYHTTGWRWNTDEAGDPLHETAGEPHRNGFVSARFRNRAVTAMLDGHVDLEHLQDLADMRRWSNEAWESNWVIELPAP